MDAIGGTVAGTPAVPIDLATWGWDDHLEAAMPADGAGDAHPGRIISASAGGTIVMTSAGPWPTRLSGHFRHPSTIPTDRPAVGDWVVGRIEPPSGPDAAMTIETVLPRRSAFVRASPQGGIDPQVVAANVDTVFIVQSLTRDLNMRRLERYLGAAWSSGADPVVVLSKADLWADLEAVLERVSQVAIGVPIEVTSAVTGLGREGLEAHLRPRRTVALLGSSGVGKSTIVNWLLGEERQLVRETRADDERGRHTTTSRELIPLPGGALVLDTPGLRSLGVWDDAGMERTFADIEALAAGCRFNDCAHDREPGCAVRTAIDDGSLSVTRLEARRKLEREIASIERRSTATSRAADRRYGRMTRDLANEAIARKRGRAPDRDDRL
ncbi:MAG TPA: ribosome small subunit-dependent GTPase A [Candidatus Limnocylindrales bacterium]|jgi:ribosome biogenesis GTPase